MKGKVKVEDTYARIYHGMPSKIRNKYEKKPRNTHQSTRQMKNYQNKKDEWDKIPQLPKGMNDCILCGGWPGFIYARDPDCPVCRNDKYNKIPVARYGSETTYGIPPTSNKAWKQRWFGDKPNRTKHMNKMTKAKDERKQRLSQSDKLKTMTKSSKSNNKMLRPLSKSTNKPLSNTKGRSKKT